VLPEYRRLGLVLAYYDAHPDRECVAFAADNNPASIALHEKAGFSRWRRGARGWFFRRDIINGHR
jgi:RimJ/RimL family protein N-acetyltransferase